MHETIPPSISGAGRLWNATGWIRGTWPLRAVGNSPSGVCAMAASLNGHPISGAGFTFPHISAYWHECGLPGNGSPAGGASVAEVEVNTADPDLPQGTVNLYLSGYDAAGIDASANRTVHLDNEPVTLNLSGPTDAPSTAGPQYVSAAATAGPSGVAGIFCSVDNAPIATHSGAGTQIPVQGVGTHTVSCYAQNNSLDARGTPARSRIKSWSVAIRQPTVSTVSFARIVDALRCTHARERVRIPARWVTGTYRGKPVGVKVPAETRTVKVVHCHPVILRRKVRDHGHWRIKRVVLLPHTVRVGRKFVAHGASAAVSGWLGDTYGNALGHRLLLIQTAPDNGVGAFSNATVTRSAADGTWSVRLAPGPSRLVRVLYGGDGTTEPSVSTAARVIVPAAVRLTIAPHHSHWGSHIRLAGSVLGGYVPTSGELIVLWIGWPGGSTEIGHLYTDGRGKFRSSYTFLRGNGRETYRLWAASAKESDYPFAPARSLSSSVTVGP